MYNIPKTKTNTIDTNTAPDPAPPPAPDPAPAPAPTAGNGFAGVYKYKIPLYFDPCVLKQLYCSGFKNIIEETKISYLRFDPNEKNIEICGNYTSCYLAKQTIYKKIFNIIEKITSNYEYVLSDLTIRWFEKELCCNR